MGLALDFPFQLEQFPITGGRSVPHRAGAAEIAKLVEQRDPKTYLPMDRSAGRLELAGHQPENAGLAGPVAAHDSPPFPGGDREVDPLENRPGPEPDGHIGKGEHGRIRDE